MHFFIIIISLSPLSRIFKSILSWGVIIGGCWKQRDKGDDTVEFTFPIIGGRVIKVYDGDTITIASKMPFADSPLYRLSVRLNGIDTPEIKGKTEDEKTAAKQVRDVLSTLILNKYITLANIQTEKYGRILADVYVGGLHVNEWLVSEKYAVKYDGGTKKVPESWLKYRTSGL